MTDAFIRLDGYLPVALPAGVGLCAELTLDALRVDVPEELTVPAGPFAATLLCSDRLTIPLVVERSSVTSGPSGFVRHELTVRDLGEEGRARLVGHISSLRKSAHLHLAATEDVEAATTRAGWHRFRLPHCALPELDAAAIDLRTRFLGKALRAPFLVSGMTGGSARAGVVNRRLATMAQELGFAFGLGSQRAMLESPELASSFAVRDLAPDVLLLGNIGLVQLNYGVTVDQVCRLVEAVGADALAVHLNVLQELVQPEGDRRWAGLADQLGALVRACPVPVLLKETGCGLDAGTARRALDLGVAAFDVGGTGGTSWGWIEGFRAADPHRKAIGATFRDWGTPTVDALRAVRAEVGSAVPVVATGGVRSGLDAAVALALSADLVGVALPFFRAADLSLDAAMALGQRFVDELLIAMMCSGSQDLAALRRLTLGMA